ncbi:cytochrome c family protein [Chelatococcus daeguensis]|uniref:Cytochrome c2 n=1 Tax=Chelatococcus sambhunathii TaxID=363953 RepID=A0ABP2A8E5_9HYPH|nr:MULTISPECIES: cytochrome c family protein [Chelatococcus]KZE32557.1 cytochrome C [Chelatococcus daeguensis]MBM3084849.1 cytochrome c family protein [Chelatococcus daeguensis]CUA87919.1 Cytochrome c2 [Chelatococcus sambhunathii]
MILKPLLAIAILVTTLSPAAAAGDAKAGERVFLKCRACHQVGEKAKNVVGPELNGLFGRTAGTAPGYSYSEANKASGIVWDEANFREYIADPRAKIPGTKMVFAGLKKEQEVDDLVAYLKTFNADGTRVAE